MKLKTPIKSVYDNLMLTKSGEIYAYYRISPVVVPQSNKEKLEDHKAEFRILFKELEKYKDIHLEMYPQHMDLEQRFGYLEKDFHPSTLEIGRYYNRETINILENELGSVTQPDFILGVRLKGNLLEGSEDIKGVVRNAFTSVSDVLVNLLGLEREMTAEFFQRFEGLEKDLFQLVASVGGRRLTEDQLIYINRYNFLRDIHHSVVEEQKKRGQTNITDAIIDPTEPGFLKLQTTEGECYTSFVVVDDFPEDMEYSHIFQRAQNLNFPVELHIKAQYQSKESTLNKIALTKQRFKQTQRDMSEVEEIDDRLLSGRELLTDLNNKIRNHNTPYLKWVATFVVSGKTKKECKHRASEVIRIMKHSQIYCVRPIADQLQLFYKFLHGAPMQFEKNWVQSTTHEGFAENLFAVSSRLGSNVGFYFGRVDKFTEKVPIDQSIASSRDIVLYHPFIANEGIAGASTDSPHVNITGATGKGKSFLVKMILLYLSFLDCQVLMTDPKVEIRKWFTKAISDPDVRVKYPMFVELIRSFHYVTLDVSDKKNFGVLDPIIFLDGFEAKETAQNIIEQIYDLHGKDAVKTEVLKTLDAVIERKAKGETVGLMHVVDHLANSEDPTIKSAGELLVQMVQNSILQLVFSYGDADAINLNRKVTILEIAGLDLPNEDDDPRYYSDSDRKSLSIMIGLAKFCEKFGRRSHDDPTAIIFDEAWTLTKARGGKRLVKDMKRVGRSFKNQLYLVSQNMADSETDDDKGNFGARFAFDNDVDRPDILKTMNLPQTKQNEEMLANMVKGQALFMDFYGRVGKLSIDCLFEEWREAFKTVEKSHSARAEEELA
ncbi:hypothetical protein C7M27_04298 (plasmid) [Bacillus subtilis]|nr:hypothetical protein C7M27_04298 [Bacillus subtilis]